MTDQVQDQRYVQAVPCKMPAAFTSNSGSNSSVSVYDIQGFSNATDVLFRTHGAKKKKKEYSTLCYPYAEPNEEHGTKDRYAFSASMESMRRRAGRWAHRRVVEGGS